MKTLCTYQRCADGHKKNKTIELGQRQCKYSYACECMVMVQYLDPEL